MERATKMDVEAEIRDLKRRVGELEGSFQFLTMQVRAVHKDLLEFREAVDRRFTAVDERGDQLHHEIQSLRHDLPQIVGSAVREVLRP
jgi:predicted  nucleic acid-binding Zn-ribbon protein